MNGSGGRAGSRTRGRHRNRGGQVSGWRENGDNRDGIQNGGREARKREWNGDKPPSSNNRRSSSSAYKQDAVTFRDKKGRFFYDRPKWVPVKKPDEPIPELVCSLCDKPITDIASAICDRREDKVFHFDCLLSQLKEKEALEEGDNLTYIGGGRFGIVHHDSRKKFTIKKIIEWDKGEERVHWRKIIADHFSST
jgi:hypothetical protein